MAKKKRKILPAIGFKQPLKIQIAYPMDTIATADFKKAIKEHNITKIKYAYRAKEMNIDVIKSVSYNLKGGGFYISKSGELVTLVESDQKVVVDTLDAVSLGILVEARKGNRVIDDTTIVVEDEETLNVQEDELEEIMRVQRVKNSAAHTKSDGSDLLGKQKNTESRLETD